MRKFADNLTLLVARRELRRSKRSFALSTTTTALATAMLTAVLGLADSLHSSLQRDARTLLGGDIELRVSGRVFEDDALSWMRASSARLSEVTSLRAAAFSEAGSAFVLVRAVDEHYPLFGSVKLTSGQTYRHAMLAPASGDEVQAIIGEDLAKTLEVTVGGVLTLGLATVRVSDLLEKPPDPSANMLLNAPLIYLSHDGLAHTGLNLPGALRSELVRIDLGGEDPEQWLARLDENFPSSAWRVRTPERAVPGLQRMINRMETLLMLISLGTMMIAGICLGSTMRAHLRSKLNSVAVLKSLGMPARQIRSSHLLVAMCFTLAGALIGLPLGYLGQDVMVEILSVRLPVPLESALSVRTVLLALAITILCANIFIAVPLHSFAATNPVRLFSLSSGHLAGAEKFPPGSWKRVAPSVVLLGALLGATATDRMFFLWFGLGGALTVALFHLLAGALARLAAAARPRGAAMKIALRTMSRSRGNIASATVALGVGLTALLTLALTQTNFERNLEQRLQTEVPPFYLVGMQPGDIERIRAATAGQLQAQDLKQMPVLRARITSLNGLPVSELEGERASHWAVRGDRYVTWSSNPQRDWRGGGTVSEGGWWKPGEKNNPQVSFGAETARELGLKLGDKVGIDILGIKAEIPITSLREIDWASFDVNFMMILSDGPWTALPHGFMGSVRRLSGDEDTFQRKLVAAAPNVTPIRTRIIVEEANKLLAKIGQLLSALTFAAIVSGLLVLAAAIAEERHRRAHDSVVLRLIGISRSMLAAVFRFEFAAVACLAALPALATAAIASKAISSWLLELDWSLDWSTALSVLCATLAAVGLMGAASTARLIRSPPLSLLRNE